MLLYPSRSYNLRLSTIIPIEIHSAFFVRFIPVTRLPTVFWWNFTVVRQQMKCAIQEVPAGLNAKYFFCDVLEYGSCTRLLQRIQAFYAIKLLRSGTQQKGILYCKRQCRWTLNILQQDRQCTYNVTLRCVLATVVEVEVQWVLHNRCVCICSLSYPAFNAHAPCCHVWPAPLYKIFPHYLINGTTLEATILNKNVCFGFFYNFCLKYFSFYE